MTSVPRGIVHQPHGKSAIECLPLEEVRVEAWVVDVSSRIVLAQTFYNPSDEPTGRAKYVFPLPASAAVCAFELELSDGTVIVGEVKEKQEAALAFTRAVEQGNATALVEMVTNDIFTISVGSIPARTRVTAHLTFVMDLLDEALRDHVRLQLPMHIAERYGTPPAAILDASAAYSRTRVHIRVDVQTSDVIYRINSPTHHIAVRHYKGRSGRKSQRRMSAVWKSSEFLTGDFVITIYAKGLDKPRCFAEALGAQGGDGEGSTIAMQLTLVPKFLTPKVSSQEYIFIIDRSGSMSGASIETAKRTLAMLLQLLPSSQTTFNIFSFGDNVTSLWRNSRGLDKTALIEVTSHVAGMGADYGGTETPKALQSAFGSRGLDRPTVVFLLTDGQIHGSENLDPWVVTSDAVRNSPPQASVRLFVLGIGNGVSSDVCSSLARQGNGEYLFALSAEDICGKCARLLNAGRSKNIERIDIGWGYDTSSPQSCFSSPSTLNLPEVTPALASPPYIQQAPHSLRSIFSGIRFTVFAITSFRTSPTSVKLTTKLEGVPDPLELIVDVTEVKPFRDTDDCSIIPIVHTLAARKLIMELDDGVGPLPTPAAGDALLVSEDDLRRAGIVRLGLTYQLMSKHTSFVAVQKGDEQIRSRGRGSGSLAWTRSRLQRNNSNILESTQEDTPAEATTFLDSLIDGAFSFIMSVFGFLGEPVTPTGATPTSPRSRPPHQRNFPGAYDVSDSSTSGHNGSLRRGRAQGQSPASHHSTDTFSSLSSLEGSSCSSRWTSSRSPSPPPRFHDPIERAPSPEFRQDTNAQPGPSNDRALNPSGPSRNRDPVSQDVFDLLGEMDVDGSFTVSSLLTRLVGDAVLNKADDLGIDRRVWVTVVAAAYMKKHLEGEPDLLELVSEKAKEFVEVNGGPTAEHFDEMVRKAVALLSA